MENLLGNDQMYSAHIFANSPEPFWLLSGLDCHEEALHALEDLLRMYPFLAVERLMYFTQIFPSRFTIFHVVSRSLRAMSRTRSRSTAHWRPSDPPPPSFVQIQCAHSFPTPTFFLIMAIRLRRSTHCDSAVLAKMHSKDHRSLFPQVHHLSNSERKTLTHRRVHEYCANASILH